MHAGRIRSPDPSGFCPTSLRCLVGVGLCLLALVAGDLLFGETLLHLQAPQGRLDSKPTCYSNVGRRRRHWAPPLGTVAGFALGMLGMALAG